MPIVSYSNPNFNLNIFSNYHPIPPTSSHHHLLVAIVNHHSNHRHCCRRWRRGLMILTSWLWGVQKNETCGHCCICPVMGKPPFHLLCIFCHFNTPCRRRRCSSDCPLFVVILWLSHATTRVAMFVFRECRCVCCYCGELERRVYVFCWLEKQREPSWQPTMVDVSVLPPLATTMGGCVCWIDVSCEWECFG